jgi:HemY protein
VARAALDAQEFAVARETLRPLLKAPTQRVAALMAEIEQRESGDEGRAREWMARAMRAARDPRWTADGFVSDRWMPVSPVNGRLDAFQWKVPLAELASDPVIDGDDPLTDPPVIVPPPAKPAELPPREPAPPPVAGPASPPVHQPAALPPSSPPPPPSPPPQRVEAVIPLIHAPDDPGPDPVPDGDPEPGPAGSSRGMRLFK